jgi:hypothetical protein
MEAAGLMKIQYSYDWINYQPILSEENLKEISDVIYNKQTE